MRLSGNKYYSPGQVRERFTWSFHRLGALIYNAVPYPPLYIEKSRPWPVCLPSSDPQLMRWCLLELQMARSWWPLQPARTQGDDVVDLEEKATSRRPYPFPRLSFEPSYRVTSKSHEPFLVGSGIFGESQEERPTTTNTAGGTRLTMPDSQLTHLHGFRLKSSSFQTSKPGN